MSITLNVALNVALNIIVNVALDIIVNIALSFALNITLRFLGSESVKIKVIKANLYLSVDDCEPVLNKINYSMRDSKQFDYPYFTAIVLFLRPVQFDN